MAYDMAGREYDIAELRERRNAAVVKDANYFDLLNELVDSIKRFKEHLQDLHFHPSQYLFVAFLVFENERNL